HSTLSCPNCNGVHTCCVASFCLDVLKNTIEVEGGDLSQLLYSSLIGFCMNVNVHASLDKLFVLSYLVHNTFGWTPQEAKMHMVADYFSHSEWNVIVEVLGPNPRHLFELFALKQSNYYQK
ncbi:unnamed protein product, partial [Ilex paraguariensis]